MGCNLGKAVTISPIVFLGSGSVLRDCHVASLLAMTRLGSAVVHQRSPAVELPYTRRSLSAATGPVGGRCHFNDSLCESFVQHREGHAPPLQWRVPRNGGRYGTAVPSRDCSPRALPHSFFSLHSFPCPAPTANTPARRKKSSDLSIGASCWRYLSSRAVTRKVLSAQMSLTSVFGMGTGVPSPQSTPTIW